MDQINRLRAMAKEAISQYEAHTFAGRDAAYPQWADDVLEVCKQAEIGVQLGRLHEIRKRASRPVFS
jgi:hypothetical protein